MSPPRRALVTGATGFVGGRLAVALADAGWQVRCLVRDRSRAAALADRGLELHEGDVLDAETLVGAAKGVEVAYYLVHSMGRGGGGDFEERDRRAAHNFAAMASQEGVPRVVYLGGLGDASRSKHLTSRHRTAEVLSREGPPLTYFRAGMVVGAESESYRTLRYLVQRLPAMIAPAWLAQPTQPIAIDDVIAYLAAAPDVAASEGREVQIGSPDVLSYGEMLDRMAEAMGLRRRPRMPVPLLTPWLSSLWIGLVTPVDAGVARPLVESLSGPTTVTDPSGAALFEIEPMPFMQALRIALAEDREAADTKRRGANVRLLPDRVEPTVGTGGVESVQEADVVIGSAPALDRELVARAGESYWRFLTRWSLGLFRVSEARQGPSVGLVARPLSLLRFGSPSVQASARSGSVTWPIRDGLLVSPAGRDRGRLRLSMERGADPPDPDVERLRVRMEVHGYHPLFLARGPLVGVRAWVYRHTQHRIHRLVTRGFLRSLARLS